MINNYIKIAWRNLVRNRAFSAINIVGLALGLATCLLISLYVFDELNYDRYHEKADRIVRVYFRGSMQGGTMKEAHVMPPTAQTLRAEYPEVEEATRLRQAGFPLISHGNKLFHEEKMAFVDPNFFQVFTLPFVKGNVKTALTQPNTVVLTRATAEKYFGNEDPIGKTLTFKDGNAVCTVTGIIEEVPANSHFHFDIFGSMASRADARSDSWMTSEYFTYLVLPEGYDYRRLEAKLPQVVEKYMGPQVQQAFGMTFAQFREKGNELGLFLQPLTDIHLHSDFAYDLGVNGDIRYVYIFGAIALFMLLIACINFMNLSTAGAFRRAQEVGVRKVMGSDRWALTWQFLLESLLLTSLALLLALLFVGISLPLFNELSGKVLSLGLRDISWLLPTLLAFGLGVGVLAGSYPAFFLSSFQPLKVLKGGQPRGAGRSGVSLRSGLVVFQFFIAILLMIGTLVVQQQLNFIQNKKLGYNKKQVLVLPDAWGLGIKQSVFRDELQQDPRVQSVSTSGYLPAGPSYNNNYSVTPADKPSQLVLTLRYEVDEAYIPTLGMQMATGRNFSREYGTDSTGIILNETAARTLGWEETALGRTLTHADNQGSIQTYRVIGVVKDFHFKSLHERISPLVMTLGAGAGTLIAKVQTDDIPGLLATLEKKWGEFGSERPFTYSFLDERFNATYKAEQKMGRILGLFAGLTIFVACLGLFGLATFTAQRRTKEIGVRKVLGASVGSIVTLLSREFLTLVLLALLVATPVAWYLMDRWLQEFAYKIDLSWWMVALSGLLAVVIALLTISFQSIKAALMNPVKSLKAE
ncbi:ABC transporter permease [Telluribacter sp.]|jgi:putative ABC transport system permease protein|uniref:ABC transporter permease n=1 Tax=Telluribacter sp. TaxID=1978767 RepID=UPI002E15F43F|nr:ABC transporter permease [Telluribacter sp.]